MEILTAEEMRAIDRRAVRTFGVPEIVLMENAGLQVFACLRRFYPDLAVRRILLLCGRGNNGGDTFVLARHLRSCGVSFGSVLFGRGSEVRGSARVNLRMLERLGEAPREVRTAAEWTRARPLLERSDLVIDGILGTGLTRPVDGLLAKVFEDVNASDAEVVAVDVPSGLAAGSAAVPGPCIAADRTVTFVRPKIAHLFQPAARLCGELHVADIGVPKEAVSAERIALLLLGEHDVVPLVPVRRADSHKGTYGHVLAVAGSRGKGGAARMVALGALRAGAGLVTAAVPAALQAGFVTRAMEAMTEAMPETPEGTLSDAALGTIAALAEGKQAVAVGPGLTSHPGTRKLIRELVPRLRAPVILDADGINAFAGAAGLLSGADRPLVLTPHPGEMARLTGGTVESVQARRVEVAREFARRHSSILVLKGHRSLVATPGGMVYVNPTGNPGMATGGAGDVLTGMIAGLVAQRIEVEGAVKLAVYLHGLAGDLAARRVGEMPLIARDILAAIPRALGRLRPPRDLDEGEDRA